MEGIGSFLGDEEWDSLSKLFSIEYDSDNFLLPLSGSSFFQNEASDYNESNLFIPSDTLDYNFNSISQESSNSSEIGAATFPKNSKENPLPSGVDFHTNNSLDHKSMNFYAMDRENDTATMPVYPDNVMEEILQLKAELYKGQKSNAKIHPIENEDSCKEMQMIKRKYKKSDQDNSSESPKKKPRKNKRNVQPKKNKKADQISNNEEENNSGIMVNSPSTSTSDNDICDASQELNSNGKARASRGSANDPQSLYARRRRERINERLKILQNLVPNGTKVDISTMLEEAVHYVKFLQLQIKLLSSDDLWMYAPIAYNGMMDMGFYQKIVSNLSIRN